MKFSLLIKSVFCQVPKRKLIVPQQMTKQIVDNYTHIQTNKYSFLMENDLPYNQLYEHFYDTPSNLLKRQAIHLFPQGMPYRIVQQKYNSYLKKQFNQYNKSFSKCQSPQQIFHMQRRIKSQIKHINRKIGILSGRHKHYQVFKSLDLLRQQKTQQQYKKKGITIKNLDSKIIYPTGKVWLPTSEYYLQLFTQYLKNFHAPVNNILDIGCGSGILSFILAKKYKKANVIAIDKNPDAVQTCSVNAASLQLLRIKSLQVDILNKNQLQFTLNKQKCAQNYDIIVCNPPWIQAKKIKEQSVIGDGVYDDKGQILSKSMQIGRKYLKDNNSRFILIFSDLSKILGLQKQSIEQKCLKNNLLIHSKIQKQFLKNLGNKSALNMYKNKAKIILYQIGKA